MSTEVNIAIVCITENGKNLALKIQTLIKDKIKIFLEEF